MGLISRVSSRTYRKKAKQKTYDMSHFTQDRTEVPPFYLEVFYRMDGRHNRPYQFEPKEKSMLANKLELYLWRDSTLKEITEKIVETISFDEAKVPGTKFDFKMVWPDTRSGNYETRNVGRLYYGEKSPDDEAEPFNNKRFHTGDLLDVAITPNRNPKPVEKKEDKKEEDEKVDSLDTSQQKQSAEEPKRLESTENMETPVKTQEIKNVAEPDPLMDDDDNDDLMDA